MLTTKNKTKSIRLKISFSVSLIVVFAIVITTLVISMIYSNEIMKRMAIIIEHKMDIIVKNLDKELNSIINLHISIQDDEELQKLILARNKTIDNKAKYDKEISDRLRQYSYENVNVSSIFAFDMDLNILDPLYKTEPYNQIINEFAFLNDFVGLNKRSSFSEPTNFPYRQNINNRDSKPTISYLSKYINTRNFSQIGYILLNIKKDNLLREFIKSCEDEFDFVVLLDESGNEIHSVGDVVLTNDDLNNLLYVNNYSRDNIVLKDLKTYIITRPIGVYDDWHVIGGISYGTLNRENRVITKIVFIIASISILIVILVSLIISKKITAPIVEVTNAMEEVKKGEWPEEIIPTTDDELKSLVEGFNKMVVDLQNLFQQVKQEQKEKNEYEINNLKLRLDILQSQINPHFIHNTLNSIKYLVQEGKIEEIVELITSFNLLLRASMSINRDFITIEQELDCVKSFLKIFEIRYDYPINVLFNVEEDIKCIKIPKLVLQPIVENSAYHGILPKGEEGLIEIRIIKTNRNSILLEIEDNGIGMTKTKVEDLLRINDGDISNPLFEGKKGFNNIGLKNINDRIRLYYGENHALKITSEIGVGTIISFEIPLDYQEE